MTSPLVLTIAAALLDFLFKSTLCFAAASVVSRLIQSPGRRFLLWLAYLTGSATYALALALPLTLQFLTRCLNRCLSHLLTPTAAHLAPANAITSAASAPTHRLWTLPAATASAATLLLSFAALAYLVTVATLAVRHLRRQAALRRALLYAYDPPTALARLTETLAKELHLSHTAVRILPGLASPATIGWLRPTVLLPATCDLDPAPADPAYNQRLSQTADILRHELHHIRRRDWLIERVARSIRALLFFQPTLTLALRRLRLERELACDQAVVSALERPASDCAPAAAALESAEASRLHYAESLLYVARVARRAAALVEPGEPGKSGATSEFGATSRRLTTSVPLPSGIEFAATPSQLETRLRAILARPDAYPRGLRGLIALSTAAIVLVVAAGLPYLTVTLAFTAANPTPNPAPKSAATPALAPPSAKTPTQDRLAGRLLSRLASRQDHSTITELTEHIPSAHLLTRTSALHTTPQQTLTAALAIPTPALATMSATPPERTRFRLEPAADTEDQLPAISATPGSTPSERGGPLSSGTNPALTNTISRNAVTVLADAAILLSRRDAGHDDH